MTARLAMIARMRRVAVRKAGAMLAHESAALANQHQLLTRIQAVCSDLKPETGPNTGTAVAARLELRDRLGDASARVRTTIPGHSARRDAAAAMRQSEQRALDTVTELHRTTVREERAKQDARAIPVRPQR